MFCQFLVFHQQLFIVSMTMLRNSFKMAAVIYYVRGLVFM